MQKIQSYLEKIADINNLDIALSDNHIGEWVFHHGMLFSSPDTWWQSHKTSKPDKRKTVHEGIDILFYKDKNKHIQQLKADAFIPAYSGGKIINICNDFISKSIIVRHNISLKQRLDLIIVYAHILPSNKIKVGINLKQGDIIATIARTDKKKTTLPPHLHFSVIEIPKNIPTEHLNWEFFSDKKSKINLMNPLFL